MAAFLDISWASQVKAQLSAEAKAKATAKAEAEEAAKAGFRWYRNGMRLKGKDCETNLASIEI